MVAPTASFTGPSFYDEQLVPVQFGPFAEQLVARIPANVRGPVLEIACGTGALTRPLRERLDASVELVATDLAPGMLDYAQARSQGRAGITWRAADAQQLPFADGAFGAVACAFGFMFCPDRLAALREARRVLAPGGLLAFTVWDRIEANPHALANAQVLEARFPGDAQMKFRTPYEMSDEGVLRDLLDGGGLCRRHDRHLPPDYPGRRSAHAGERADPRHARSALLVERGVALDEVIDEVAAALARQGGSPYAGHAQARIVTARVSVARCTVACPAGCRADVPMCRCADVPSPWRRGEYVGTWVGSRVRWRALRRGPSVCQNGPHWRPCTDDGSRNRFDRSRRAATPVQGGRCAGAVLAARGGAVHRRRLGARGRRRWTSRSSASAAAARRDRSQGAPAGRRPVTLLLHKPAGMGTAQAQAALGAASHWSGDTSGIRRIKSHGAGQVALLALPTPASGLAVFSQDGRIVRKLTEDAA
jgi:SAM-dependent methyltransferase